MSITVYGKRNDGLSAEDLLKMAEEFATKNGIFYGIYDEGNRYRVDFYFYNTVINDIDGWLKLLRASDTHTMYALPRIPERICVRCYFIKRV